MTLLQVDGASKRFGNLVAIDDVSLAIEPGELRAIIGPNGAGKTTFFNLVSGLFAPTSGAILFDGRDVTALAPEQRVARGMARTFQITEIFPELSVGDNIRVAVEIAAGYRLKPWLGRAARAKVEERVSELLVMGGLAEKKDDARRRAVARRPAGDGNHDVARVAPAPADARRADGGDGRPGDL